MTIKNLTHIAATPKPHVHPTPEGSGGNKHTKGDIYKICIELQSLT